ncbi:MAG: SCP2 sterol-binding domain-containing protein [Rhodobacteraceae bacterium]|nr:SCP2 sterol-binding domain-containing protein [Paracoccaceae bacterium]
MSAIIQSAVAVLTAKLSGRFDGSAKFMIEGEGAIIIDSSGVRTAKDGEKADVTMTADADTFHNILSGDMNPTAAFMGGRMKIDGDMGAAMRLGSVLG